MVQRARDETGLAVEREERMKKAKDSLQEESQTQTPRRSFLNKLWMGLGFLAMAEVIALVGAFLWPRNNRTKGAMAGLIITAGPVDKFKVDSVTAFVRGKFIWPGWRTAVSWLCRANVPIWGVPSPGFLKKGCLNAPVMPRHLISGVKWSDPRRPAPLISIICLLRTMWSKWIRAG